MISPTDLIHSINASDPYDNVTENSEQDELPLLHDSPSEDSSFPKTRHILGLMGFLGFANVYAMRVNLSVAIVAMVNHTALPQTNISFSDTCPVFTNITTHPVKYIDCLNYVTHTHKILLISERW